MTEKWSGAVLRGLGSSNAPRLPDTIRQYPAGKLAAFQQYMRTMLSGDQLAVTPAARELAALVLHPPGLPVAWPLFEAAATLTTDLLPARLREMYGYHWGRGQHLLFDAWVRSTRRALPQLPPWLREFPAARTAEQRVAHALNAAEARQRPVTADW